MLLRSLKAVDNQASFAHRQPDDANRALILEDHPMITEIIITLLPHLQKPLKHLRRRILRSPFLTMKTLVLDPFLQDLDRQLLTRRMHQRTTVSAREIDPILNLDLTKLPRRSTNRKDQ
jgi:hypothetical protein